MNDADGEVGVAIDLLTSWAFERVARQWAQSAIVQAPSAKLEGNDNSEHNDDVNDSDNDDNLQRK